jgi:hypothetical protein
MNSHNSGMRFQNEVKFGAWKNGLKWKRYY